MNPLQAFVYTLIVCSLSFVFGAWWCSVGQANKHLDDLATKPHEPQKVTRHPFIDVCNRCGKSFDLTTSPDPALDVCPECWEVLKNNPDDDYFKKESNQ